MTTRAMPEQEVLQEDGLRLRAALTYARRGWHVFPIHTPADGACSCRKPDCKDIGKHPRTMNGWKDATTKEEQIRKWWGMWPDANVGIACGPSGLVVVDVDPRHGGDESLRDLTSRHGEECLDTVSALTGGGGGHYLYQAPGGRSIRNAAGIFPGIDLRGDGGYIVAPPSLHESGGHYAWERTANEADLLEFPEAIFRAERPAARTAQPIGDVIPTGQRDTVLTSLAGTMRRRGMSEAAILAALQEENAARCDPPLPAGDLKRIARSVARYDPADDAVLRVRPGAPTFSNLRKHLVEPPVWVLRVEETDVRLSTKALSEYNALCLAVLDQINVVLPFMKPSEWKDQLRVLIGDLELVDAPEDASESGIVWATVVEYLAQRTEVEERFEQGRPVERDGEVFATGSMLREAMRSRGVVVEQRKIWEAVRSHGGTNGPVRISGKLCRTWAIPTEALK